MIIYLYYFCLLRFTSYTGFGLTNEDSRATFLFTIVFLFTIGGVLNLLGLEVLNLPLLLSVVIVIASFLGFYSFFKKETVKNKMSKAYEALEGKQKYGLILFAIIYTFLSAIFFIKST